MSDYQVHDRRLYRNKSAFRLAPHGTIVKERIIYYRSGKGQRKEIDFVSYMNSKSVCQKYRTHLYFNNVTNTVVDTWTGRQYSLNWIAPGWQLGRNTDEIIRVVNRQYGSAERKSLSRYIQYKEKNKKEDIPKSTCKWLFCSINSHGHCGIIADQWLYRIGKGKHILDSSPTEAEVLQVHHAGHFRYKSISRKEWVTSELFQTKHAYRSAITNLLLRRDGAYYQVMKWSNRKRNKISTHAFAFIVKRPLAYFMDGNSGCVVCYDLNDFVQVCTRFLNDQIDGNFRDLHELKIHESHIKFNHL